MVSQPQPDAEGLEPVVGVQCLGEGQEAASGPWLPGQPSHREQSALQRSQDHSQAPVSPIQMSLQPQLLRSAQDVGMRMLGLRSTSSKGHTCDDNSAGRCGLSSTLQVQKQRHRRPKSLALKPEFPSG